MDFHQAATLEFGLLTLESLGQHIANQFRYTPRLTVALSVMTGPLYMLTASLPVAAGEAFGSQHILAQGTGRTPALALAQLAENLDAPNPYAAPASETPYAVVGEVYQVALDHDWLRAVDTACQQEEHAYALARS